MSKKLKLKNYTSQVPCERSVMLIEQKLVEVGATHIAKSYEGQRLSGIIFQVDQNGQPMSFRLPANVESITEMMLAQIRKPRKSTTDRVKTQAERTARKLLLDWVDVQVSMIEIGRRQVAEVFLPYLYDFKKDKTLFQELAGSGFKLLTKRTT